MVVQRKHAPYGARAAAAATSRATERVGSGKPPVETLWKVFQYPDTDFALVKLLGGGRLFFCRENENIKPTLLANTLSGVALLWVQCTGFPSDFWGLLYPDFTPEMEAVPCSVRQVNPIGSGWCLEFTYPKSKFGWRTRVISSLMLPKRG